MLLLQMINLFVSFMCYYLFIGGVRTVRWGSYMYSYVFIPICLLSDKFLLKSIRLRFISKEISQAVHNKIYEYSHSQSSY